MNVAFKKRRSRIGVLALVLASFFILVVLRLVGLVVFDGPRLNSLARSEHTERVELAAVRGPIVDRHGKPLALSAESRSVYARPRIVLESSTAAQRAHLAAALGLSSAELDARLARQTSFTWLARRIARDRADAVEALGLEGVGAVSEYKRFYPESNLAAAVVGMAGMDGQGLSGIESQYDRMIRGAPIALQVDHDAMGHSILDSPLALRNAEPGARLELTLDADIQMLAEKQLSAQIRTSGAARGSAIVLDPFTGEVLALATVAANKTKGDERLHDSVVQDAFEPGSTVKGILGAVALEDRAVTPEQQFFCENGAMQIGQRVIHDHGNHDWLDLGGIIRVSSNIGAAKVAMALGANRYYEGLKAFGFASRTGIDLPGEASGLLRAPAKWTPIELANHGFGQGIAVTPIQLAAAYAAIANGGLLMRPFVVRAAYDAAGNEILRHTPQVLRRAVSPDVAHTMNGLLRAVVNSEGGTGRRAQVADFTVAGKTGTAQIPNPGRGYYQNRLVASFVGFVPADDPRLVILVVLEDVGQGHEGGLVAAPVFSAIAAGALSGLEIAGNHRAYEGASLLPLGAMPEDEPAESAPAPASAALEPARGASATPDFSGLSLRAALALARQTGVNLKVEGSGYVTVQKPVAGARLRRGAAVKLTLVSSGGANAPGKTAAVSRRARRSGA